MNATDTRRAGPSFSPLPRFGGEGSGVRGTAFPAGVTSPPKRGRGENEGRPWWWAALLLLAAGLILCHGCHGADVDDELSVLLGRDRRSPPQN
jgi:hypothetical protein